MSRIVNVANVVISRTEELYSWLEKRGQFYTNKLIGAPGNDSLGQRNFFC